MISIVIPVYRSAETLHELHRRVRRVLEDRSLAYEMLFVDDACPGGSRIVLEEVLRSDPRVTVLTLERNIGQQRAVLAGVARARGDVVVVMDADLQDPPEAMPNLLAPLDDGFGAVFAGRRGTHQPFRRQLTSRAFKWMLHLLCGTPTDAGLFVAMSRPMVESLLAFRPGPSVVAMLGCAGLPLTSVPVARSRRSAGQSSYTSWKRLTMGVVVIGWAIVRKWRADMPASRTGAL